MKMKKGWLMLLVGVFLAGVVSAADTAPAEPTAADSAPAQPAAKDDATDLAKQTQNPVAT